MAAVVPVHDLVRGLATPTADRRRVRSGPAAGCRSIERDDRAGTRRRRRSAPRGRLRGELRLPGDKSISHRALLLAALAAGESRIEGAGDGADVRSTAGIVRALGATVERIRRRRPDGRLPGRLAGRRRPRRARRRPRLRQLRHEPAAHRRHARRPAHRRASSTATLHCVAVRWLVSSNRCVAMGAALHARQNDSLPPLTVVGRYPARGRSTIATPVPSAQVKSAILLAGLRADGRTTVRESIATRDHTERMLRARGVAGRARRRRRRAGELDGARRGGGAGDRRAGARAMSPRPPSGSSPASIHPDAELTLHDVGVNPTRRAVIDLLRRDGRGHRRASRSGGRRADATTASASRSPTCRPLGRRCTRSTSARPTSPRRSTRSRSCAWPPRAPAARPRSAAPASCATRNPTGSPGSPPA